LYKIESKILVGAASHATGLQKIAFVRFFCLFENKINRILEPEKTRLAIRLGHGDEKPEGKQMSEFQLYFGLGKDHILDANGYDHILFVIALCVLYSLKEWKQVLILVTAFTLGHSVTLALATLEIISVDAALVEFLIPVTILITAVSNIVRKGDATGGRSLQLNYAYAAFFGLIHGMGFSNYLKSILGRDESIFTQLLAFNLGLELGQIVIVAFFLVLGFILVDLFGVNRRDWKLVISSAVAGIAIILIKDKTFW
jgi:hypothetical protein